MKRLVVGLVCMLVLACGSPGPSPSVPPAPFIGISNGTTLTVTLFVNGQRVAVEPPGRPLPSTDPASLPPLPWNVEARAPAGRVLTAMQGEPGELQPTILPGGGVEVAIPFGRVDLSCGRLTIWAGDNPPSGPPPGPSPGTPGDCSP